MILSIYTGRFSNRMISGRIYMSLQSLEGSSTNLYISATYNYIDKWLVGSGVIHTFSTFSGRTVEIESDSCVELMLVGDPITVFLPGSDDVLVLPSSDSYNVLDNGYESILDMQDLQEAMISVATYLNSRKFLEQGYRADNHN